MSVGQPVAEIPGAAADPAPVGSYDGSKELDNPAPAADGEFADDMGKALDALFGQEEGGEATPGAETPPDGETPPTEQVAEEPPAEPVAEPQADAVPDPRDQTIAAMAAERKEFLALATELARRNGVGQQVNAPKPDAMAKFAESLKAQGMDIKKPELIEAQFKAQQAWFESQFGMTPSEFKAQRDAERRALESMASGRAAEADQSRTMQEFSRMKAEHGFDALGADREFTNRAVSKYLREGSDSTYTKPVNIPPDVLAQLARLEKIDAEAKGKADETARAQKAKQAGKPASAPAPKAASATAGKGMAPGIQLTDEQLSKMDMGEILRRMNLFGQ